MDGKADKTPYSIPKVYNMLVVGGDSVTPSVSSDDQLKGLVRLREGTRGEFGNVILTNVGNTGVYQDKCQSETLPTLTARTTPCGGRQTTSSTAVQLPSRHSTSKTPVVHSLTAPDSIRSLTTTLD